MRSHGPHSIRIVWMWSPPTDRLWLEHLICPANLPLMLYSDYSIYRVMHSVVPLDRCCRNRFDVRPHSLKWLLLSLTMPVPLWRLVVVVLKKHFVVRRKYGRTFHKGEVSNLYTGRQRVKEVFDAPLLYMIYQSKIIPKSTSTSASFTRTDMERHFNPKF